MSMRRFVRGAAIAAAVLAQSHFRGAAASAQEAVAPEHGQRVKVEVACDGTRRWSGCGAGRAIRSEAGSFLGRTGDSLLINADRGDSVLVLPTSSVVRTWAASGTRGNGGIGALVGLVVGGVAAGLIVAPAAGASDSWQGAAYSMGSIGAGALVGALFGAVAGHTVRSDRWAPAVVPRSVPFGDQGWR